LKVVRMPQERFRVRKMELWVQEVWVEADSQEHALLKAEKGDYEIHDDPQYHADLPVITWEIE
jgi:hypothetical protein